MNALTTLKRQIAGHCNRFNCSLSHWIFSRISIGQSVDILILLGFFFGAGITLMLAKWGVL
jgi:hypothetical protein